MKILTTRGYREISIVSRPAGLSARSQAIIEAGRMARAAAGNSQHVTLRLEDLPPPAPNRLLGAYINEEGDAV